MLNVVEVGPQVNVNDSRLALHDWPPSITARYFSSCPSDSTSRWTPCPPGPTSGGFRSALLCFRLSPSCPFRLLHTYLSPGQRGITPAFGYGAPHPSAGGTSTLPASEALPP